MFPSCSPSMTRGSCDQGTPTPRHRKTPSSGQRKSPSRVSYEAILADRRLTPFDKLVVSILADHCLSDGKAICWPSTSTLAKLAGVAESAEDGGEARVLRSLAKLQRLAIIERIGRYEIADWMTEVGRPKLGLADPRPDGDPRRYILLRWKVPGYRPTDGPDPKASPEASRPGAGARVNKRLPGAVDRCDLAPSTGGTLAPAPGLRTCSKFELRTGTTTRVVGVVPAAPGGEEGQTPEVHAAPRTASPPPIIPGPPPLDPAIAAELARHVADPVERAEVGARMPAWLSEPGGLLAITVELVILAIRETIERRQRKGKVRNLADYAGGMLDRWRASGQVETTYAKRAGPTKDPAVLAEAEAKAKAAKEAKRAEEARAEALLAGQKARWKSLPEPEKQRRRADFRAEHPNFPASTLDLFCIAAMPAMEEHL